MHVYICTEYKYIIVFIDNICATNHIEYCQQKGDYINTTFTQKTIFFIESIEVSQPNKLNMQKKRKPKNVLDDVSPT